MFLSSYSAPLSVQLSGVKEEVMARLFSALQIADDCKGSVVLLRVIQGCSFSTSSSLFFFFCLFFLKTSGNMTNVHLQEKQRWQCEPLV